VHRLQLSRSLKDSPGFLAFVPGPEGRIVCPGSKLNSCSMSSFYTTGDQKPRVELLATVSLVASCCQLLGIQSLTTNNLIAGHAQKAWSLVFIGVVWAEFKLLAGMVLIISFGPGSYAGKVGAYACGITKLNVNTGTTCSNYSKSAYITTYCG